MKKLRKNIKNVVLLLLVIFLCIWLGAVAKCEYLTIRYGDQFQDAYRKYTMLSRPDYMKILEYGDDRAVVYYVKRGAGGDTLIFERDDEQSDWEFISWITVWSRSGSADDFVWPYIR